MVGRAPISTLFPYTTLFRSIFVGVFDCVLFLASSALFVTFEIGPASRSEEHTSELQSRFDLVCGLLLEKKNPLPHTAGLEDISPAFFQVWYCDQLCRICGNC